MHAWDQVVCETWACDSPYSMFMNVPTTNACTRRAIEPRRRVLCVVVVCDQTSWRPVARPLGLGWSWDLAGRGRAIPAIGVVAGALVIKSWGETWSVA